MSWLTGNIGKQKVGFKMAIAETKRWKEWADELRQEMMVNLNSETTKSVDAIKSETNSTKTEKAMKSVRFWQSCQSGTSPNEHLTKAGFDIDFECDEANQVQEVTLRLNEAWMSILQKVIDRYNRKNR